MSRRLIAIAVLFAAGCGDDEPTVVEGLPTVDGAPELVVVGTDFAFEPAALHLDAGEPVNVVFEASEGGHNFVVATDDPFALPIVDEGETTTGALTIDEPGTYELVCTVPGHAEEGMVGTVEVSPPGG
jgi:plastocyanin